MTKISSTAFRILAAISLVVGFTLPASACGWTPEFSKSRYPAFQFIDTPDYSQGSEPDRVNDEVAEFWSDYLGHEIKYYTISGKLANLTTEIVRKRDTSNELIRRLVDRGDEEALEFLELEMEFQSVNAPWGSSDWSYNGTDEDIIEGLTDRIDAGLASAPKALFGRYLFLDVRAKTALNDYKGVIELWDKYSKRLPEGKLKERIRGYLGGAYYHTGRYFDALDIFADNGEGTSLGWCLQKMAGIDNLKKLLKERPNSRATQYVLQDYANYLWMLWICTHGAYNTALPGDRYGQQDRLTFGEYTGDDPELKKLYDNDAAQNRRDFDNACAALVKLADEALANSKVKEPMVWAEAKAFTLIITGKAADARTLLAKASTLEGTKAMRRNLSRLSLWADLATLDESDRAASADVAARYSSLYRLAKSQKPFTVVYPDWEDTPIIPASEIAEYVFLHDALVPYFAKFYAGTPLAYRALAMLYGIGDRSERPEGTATAELPVGAIEQLVERLEGRIALNAVDQSILAQSAIDKNPFYDALGRASFVEGNYEQALAHFNRVSPYWSALQGFNAYLANRSLDKSVDFGRKQRSWEVMDSDSIVAPVPVLNHRAILAQRIGQLDKAYRNASGADKARAGYELARNLFQISAQGDLWAATDNVNSITKLDDAVSRRAQSILDASLPVATDPNLKARILYGIASISPYDACWPEHERNSQRIIGYRWCDPTEVQLDAYRQLAKLYPSVSDPTVRSCDILRNYIAGSIAPAR